PRRAELPGIALAAHDAQQVLEGIAELLAVVIRELVDPLEELTQRGRVAVREVGVLEDVPEQLWQAGVLLHALQRLAVELHAVLAAQVLLEKLRPGVLGVVRLVLLFLAVDQYL